jgi:hypothetical protein
MSEAGWFGVAVRVAPAVPVSAGGPGRRLSDVLDPAGMTEAGLVGELYAVGDARSKLAAYEAAIVAQLAARRPASSDRSLDEPGHRVAGWTADAPLAGVCRSSSPMSWR